MVVRSIQTILTIALLVTGMYINILCIHTSYKHSLQQLYCKIESSELDSIHPVLDTTGVSKDNCVSNCWLLCCCYSFSCFLSFFDQTAPKWEIFTLYLECFKPLLECLWTKFSEVSSNMSIFCDYLSVVFKYSTI